jgi:hypothetical protein
MGVIALWIYVGSHYLHDRILVIRVHLNDSENA